jgi:uncharacterized protein
VTKRASIYVGLLCVVLALPACKRSASGFATGQQAYDKKDYATALKKWKPLAEGGHAQAQFSLSGMYANGQGVTEDYAEAARWLRKAAEQGDAEAQFRVGLNYHLDQNHTEAARWNRKAAEQGHAQAQSTLGYLYDQGLGVPQDYVVAHMWANLATSRATGVVREIFQKDRDSVAPKLTPAQLAEAQRRAREWEPKSGGEKGGRPMK